MFSITVVFGASPVPWTLLFKTQESFNSAISGFKSPQVFGDVDNIDVADDYGQRIYLKRSSIHGIIFEDTAQSKMAQIERALHNDRVNIEANMLRKADPAISAHMQAQARQAAPGVITPFGPNGAFRQ